jgi:hypothetical protein
MHAAARAKTPRTKPAADPWQALPGLADLFDSQTPQPFFKGSKVSALEELALTETKLLEQTASILGISLAQLVKAGTLVYAKREFLNHNKYSAAEGGDSESALLRSGSGVAGVADARILAAYQAMAGPHPHHPGQARHQSRHRIPHRPALAQDPSPRIIGLQARRGLRRSRDRRSCRPSRRRS